MRACPFRVGTKATGGSLARRVFVPQGDGKVYRSRGIGGAPACATELQKPALEIRGKWWVVWASDPPADRPVKESIENGSVSQQKACSWLTRRKHIARVIKKPSDPRARGFEERWEGLGGRREGVRPS